ncbi:hypothetical protein ACKKBF_B37785 [Auxenochlorella protothecoides x Auxenochlorella symbiontica]
MGKKGGKKNAIGRNPGSDHDLVEDDSGRRHELYQQAVQSPRGDLSYCRKFHQTYIGSHEPRHLREDFCGTALLAATWCRGGVFRSAVGLDLDRPTLDWGARHNGEMLGGSAQHQLALLEGNVLDPADSALLVPFPEAGPEASASQSSASDESDGEGGAPARRGSVRSRPCDIVCALNFGVCLLHTRTHLLRYLRHVAAALDQARGGIFVADLLGGPAAERDLTLPRHNSTTGLGYTWVQSGFDPVTRRMTGTIRLREMDGREARRYNFHYDWRMWTVPDVRELLRQAGFSTTYVWIRPIKDASAGDGGRTSDTSGSQEASGSDSEESEGEADFQPHEDLDPEARQRLQRGWSAYIVAVLAPQPG